MHKTSHLHELSPMLKACCKQQVALQARADTAYTAEWDAAEQAALDSALARFPADRHPPLERYVRAAACLPKKCVTQRSIHSPHLPCLILFLYIKP